MPKLNSKQKLPDSLFLALGEKRMGQKWVIGMRQRFRVLSSTMPKMRSIFWSRESTLSGNKAQWVESGKQQTKKLASTD